MNKSRLMKLERFAALMPVAKRSEAEALALLDCLTDEELESLCEAKVPPVACGQSYAAESVTPESVASYAALAEAIFSARPDLLESCRRRLVQRRGDVPG